jgi:hypothetical protein
MTAFLSVVTARCRIQTLQGSGMTLETADSWLDAWVLEATSRDLPRVGAYWPMLEGTAARMDAVLTRHRRASGDWRVVRPE